MKITLVADVYGEVNNGTSITARRLMENLKKRGHEVKIISAYPESDIVLPKRKFIAFNNYIEKTNGVSFADIDEEKLRQGISDSDVVHFLLPFKVCRKGLEIARELHIPFTTAFHCQPENITSHIGLKNWSLPNKFIYKKFLRSFYKNAEFIHCPSKLIADELDKNGYKAKKYVISNGVIPKFTPMEIKKPKELEDKICILFIGRYSKEKRHDLLIKAVNNSKYRDKIQLFFAGNGPLKKKIEKLGNTLPNKPILKFFQTEELHKIINYADLYVHPSDIEIEAISCIEAFTCGKVPIISNSKRSATKQFALSENNLFEAGNPKSLAEKIDYWIEHPQEVEEYSKKYVEYSKEFSIENSIDKMEQMFYDAVEFYKEYYAKLPKVKLRPEIKYPENPEEHIFTTKKNKKHKVVDENWKYKRKNPFYIIGAGFLRLLALIFLPIWMKCSTHYKIRGKENLKGLKKKGVVIVSNHVHPTDSPLIATRVFGAGRKVRIITLSGNMDIPVASDLMVALGAIPIADTIRGVKNFTTTINELLQKGKPVLFFPEAALWPYYRGLRPFHKGAFTFAVKNKAIILPILTTFTTKKNGKQKMVLTICQPIMPQDKSAEELREYTEDYCKNYLEDFYKKYR